VLRALLIDMDGTPCASEAAHRGAFNRAFAEAGLPYAWDEAPYGRLLAAKGRGEGGRRPSPLRLT